MIQWMTFLQDFLGFAPSRQALAVVQDFAQAQAAQQQQCALSRLQLAAALTARRCAAVPLYGQDLCKVQCHLNKPRGVLIGAVHSASSWVDLPIALSHGIRLYAEPTSQWLCLMVLC